MVTKSILVGAVLILTTTAALPQSGNAINVFGTVQEFDAATVTVKSDNGGELLTFKVAPNVLLLQIKTVTLSDIRPNDFVASAAVRKEDGKLHSTKLRIYPEALRGQGEGQFPMTDGRQTMTNATVTGAAVINGSNNLKVKFKGGESELVVDPGIPITRTDSVDKMFVKRGEKVRVQGTRSTDAELVTRITLQ